MPASRVLLRSAQITRVLTRSAFTARKPDYTNPNWLRVGLAFGSTVALWVMGYFCLSVFFLFKNWRGLILWSAIWMH